MSLDAELLPRCLAAGLDPDELAALGEKEGMGAVFRALVGAELAAMTGERDEAADRGADRGADRRADPVPVGVGSRRWRRQAGSSAPLTIRFDHDELAELRRRAEVQGIGVSVLARCYVRKELGARPLPAWD